jgi:UDP-2,3-diacylglucosamine pyrophosphatase LpxH
MDIQYISDIHLEFHDKHNKGALQPDMFVKPAAPYLALVGDIGIPDLQSYKVFLEWCSQNWKQVFLVAGNHEYYNVRCDIKTDIETKEKKIQDICETLPNVSFLNCSSVYLKEYNLRILGCTLWSYIPESIQEKAITYMNDARQILAHNNTPFTPWHMTQQHIQQKQWLHEEINGCKLNNEKCLVLTHYLPSFTLIHEKYKENMLNFCFASESDELFREPVVGWICGHTHTGMKRIIEGIPCMINPYGYPHEQVETRNREAVFHIA